MKRGMRPLQRSELSHGAIVAGEMLARGQISLDDVRNFCSTMAHMTPKNFDRSGLQMRLVHRAVDRAGWHEAAVRRTERAIRFAVRPMFRVGASKAEIEDVAGKLAEGSPLEPPMIFWILREELRLFRRVAGGRHEFRR